MIFLNRVDRVVLLTCLRNECLFSLFMGMNQSAGQTNRVNREAVSDDLFVPCSDSFPMNPEKKTLIPYIDNVSNKDPF